MDSSKLYGRLRKCAAGVRNHLVIGHKNNGAHALAAVEEVMSNLAGDTAWIR